MFKKLLLLGVVIISTLVAINSATTEEMVIYYVQLKTEAGGAIGEGSQVTSYFPGDPTGIDFIGNGGWTELSVPDPGTGDWTVVIDPVPSSLVPISPTTWDQTKPTSEHYTCWIVRDYP